MLSHFRRTRPAIGVVVATVFALAGTACSGDDAATTTTEKRTTTTKASDSSEVAAALAETMRSSTDGEFILNDEEAACAADSLVEELGEDDALALSRQSADMSETQKSALAAAFDACVDAKTAAGPLTAQFYTGFGDTEPPAAVSACVADRIEGKVGTFLTTMADAAGKEATAKVLDVFGACIPSEDVGALLAAQFTTQGATDAQAQCMAGALKDVLTLAKLYEIGTSGGEIPAEDKAAITQAATTCGLGQQTP